MVPGSGFNFEETTPAYLAEIKADVEYLLRSTNLSSQSINLPLILNGSIDDICLERSRYAKARGIEVGGYDLISDTRGGTGFDAISPLTHKGTGSACMASAWEGILESKIMTFVNETGISMIETDGVSTQAIIRWNIAQWLDQSSAGMFVLKDCFVITALRRHPLRGGKPRSLWRG